MYKLVALFRQPEDVESFDEHYFNTHTPLMEAVPGYERIEDQSCDPLDGG